METNNSNEKWVTVAQLCEHFPIKKDKIYKDVANETIPYRRWNRGPKSKLLFKISIIEKWLEDKCPSNNETKVGNKRTKSQ